MRRLATSRKLIVFTEHRDIVNYLVDRLHTLLGDHDAVVHMSCNTRQDQCKAVQNRFTQDPDVIVLSRHRSSRRAHKPLTDAFGGEQRGDGAKYRINSATQVALLRAAG